MSKLNLRHTKTELAKQLGIRRATLYVYLKQYEADRETRIQLNQLKRLTEALGVLLPSFTVSQLINMAEAGKYKLVLEDLHPREYICDIDGL